MLSFQSLLLGFLNRLIQHESWAEQRLIVHRDAVVKIEAGPVVLTWQIADSGIFVEASQLASPAVTLSLPADAPLMFIFDRPGVFSAVKIAGSADIAETLAFVLKNLRWDIEADAAGVIGDIPARRLVQFGYRTAEQIQNGAHRVVENLSEYATEDSTILPPRREILQFDEAVSTLRDDVARLEKRIARLST